MLKFVLRSALWAAAMMVAVLGLLGSGPAHAHSGHGGTGTTATGSLTVVSLGSAVLQCFEVERHSSGLSASEPTPSPETGAAKTCCGNFACHATVSPEHEGQGPAAVTREAFALLNAAVLPAFNGSGLERPPKAAR
jgi:hypothetical protein